MFSFWNWPEDGLPHLPATLYLQQISYNHPGGQLPPRPTGLNDPQIMTENVDTHRPLLYHKIYVIAKD